MQQCYSPYQTSVTAMFLITPFGSAMPTRAWTDESRGYRYGFNGMEKDDEVKGEGNSYDFGARILDSRLGRWLSLDPLYKKFAGFSNFIYARNSPVILIDIGGKHPKVAIIMIKTPSKPFEFDDHVRALQALGYEVVRVQNGKELVDALINNSSPESPISELTILSHGFTGGLVGMGYDVGLQTDEEVTKTVSWILENKQRDKIRADILNNPLYADLSIDEIDNMVQQKYKDYEASDQYGIDLVNEIQEYKEEHNLRTTCDIVNAMDNDQIVFSDDARPVIFAGCNTNLYAEDFTAQTGMAAIGSRNQTEPAKRPKGESTILRRCRAGWNQHNSDGEITDLGKGKLNTATAKVKPE